MALPRRFVNHVPRGRILVVLASLAVPGCGKEEAQRESGKDTVGAARVTAIDASRAIFVDVTEQVGIEFHHFVGNAKYYFPEIMGSGCAVLDYDNDGDLDVYALQGALLNPVEPTEDSMRTYRGEGVPRNRLFRNDLELGGLHFTEVTDRAGVGDTGYAMGCAVADYDNDGYVDLYVTNYGPNVLYRNNGDGTFTDVTAAAGVGNDRWGASASFADLNDDGLVDLYVANYVDWRLSIDRECHSASGARDYCAPIVYKPAPDALFFQRPNGLFEDVSSASGIDRGRGNGLGVVCADFNGDGRTDVYVANDGTANFLWINRGDGTFEDQALLRGAAVNDDGLTEAGMGVTAGDYDADGDDDLFVTHLNRETSTLYLNDGRGVFRDATIEVGLANITRQFTGFGTRWFDYDNDGRLDLFSANGDVYWQESAARDRNPYRQRNQLLHQSRPGRFEDVSGRAGPPFAIAEVSRGIACGDLDNDGDIDVVLMNNNGPLRVLRNEVGSGSGHWLSLRLEGTASNRSAIGARIALTLPQGPTLWRRVHSDGSYCSANDLRVHFGLGGSAACGDAVIHWPSGLVETYTGLPPDATTSLGEGQGKEQR